MRTIYKYQLPRERSTILTLTADALPLHAGVQHDRLTVWVELDPEAEKRFYRFHVVPTGGEVPLIDEDLHPAHLGTVHDGPYVWHIYWDRDDWMSRPNTQTQEDHT